MPGNLIAIILNVISLHFEMTFHSFSSSARGFSRTGLSYKTSLRNSAIIDASIDGAVADLILFCLSVDKHIFFLENNVVSCLRGNRNVHLNYLLHHNASVAFYQRTNQLSLWPTLSAFQSSSTKSKRRGQSAR